MSEGDTPWSRVQRRFTGLFAPVDPRAPPQEVPPELQEWAWNTGMLAIITSSVSGSQEFFKHRLEPVKVPPHLPPALHDIYLRNQQSGRVAKVASRALSGYLYGLAFGGLFYGADIVAGIASDQRDPSNTACAGCMTGCIFGSTLPGPLSFRLSRAVMGGGIGLCTGALVGFLSHKVVPLLDDRAGRSVDEADN